MNEKPLVPFKGTIVQEEQLKKVIAEHREQKGGLMPVLSKHRRYTAIFLMRFRL